MTSEQLLLLRTKGRLLSFTGHDYAAASPSTFADVVRDRLNSGVLVHDPRLLDPLMREEMGVASGSGLQRPPASALRRFLQSEASGGLLLMGAAALALFVANSPLAEIYHHALETPLGPVLTPKLGPMTPHLWINDGLMAIFFLLVGLEIKREFVDGNLRTWNDRRLPIIAAAAGMVVPAAVYLALTGGTSALVSGWAVPAATDIAFAIGVLSLLGKRAPTSLKLFLTTVAIVDDLGAVAIIAMAYTAAINTLALGGAAAILMAMYFMNRSGVRSLWPYLLLGLLLWYAVLLSGVHATVAGVLTAAMIPIKPTPGRPDAGDSPLHRLEHGLARWVAFLIIPVFGFTNAGVSLEGVGVDQLVAPLPLGIAAGLFLGKQIGIFGAVAISAKLGIACRPAGATWLQTYAVAMLCGVGFTMSLFIGALAFPARPDLIEEAKMGVLVGSGLSAIVGYFILRFAPQQSACQPRRGEAPPDSSGGTTTTRSPDPQQPVPAGPPD